MDFAEILFLGTFLYVVAVSILIIYAISKYYTYFKGSTVGKIVLSAVFVILGIAILALEEAIVVTFLPQSLHFWTYLSSVIYLTAALTVTYVVINRLAPKFTPLKTTKEAISDYEGGFSEGGSLPNIHFTKIIFKNVKQKDVANHLSYMLGKITALKVAHKYAYLHKGITEIIPELKELFGVDLTFKPDVIGLRARIPLDKFNFGECELICIHFQGFWEEFISTYLKQPSRKALLNFYRVNNDFICELSLKK